MTSTSYNKDAKKDDGSCFYTEPYYLTIPKTFDLYLPAPKFNADNPLSVQGVALGKKLYYDPILDGNGQRSCSDCHFQSESFSETTVNSQPHINLAWNNNFLWNGKIQGSVEDIMLFEVEEFFNSNIEKINANDTYLELFYKAYGVNVISSEDIAKALAQFIRTIISGESKFDKFINGETVLTSAERNGFDVFMSGERGDCFHCHGDPNNPLWTDNQFHNNGLDESFSNLGLGDITNNPADNGKFKTPTLRNLKFTAPYMHDGRFTTLDEVIQHYSTGVKKSATIDPLMQHADKGGAQLTQLEANDLKAFLLTLTDESVLTNKLLAE